MLICYLPIYYRSLIVSVGLTGGFMITTKLIVTEDIKRAVMTWSWDVSAYNPDGIVKTENKSFLFFKWEKVVSVEYGKVPILCHAEFLTSSSRFLITPNSMRDIVGLLFLPDDMEVNISCEDYSDLMQVVDYYNNQL